MKVAKKVLALTLSVILILSMTVNAFAATSKEVAAEAGRTVSVTLNYANIAGIQGTFSTPDTDVIDSIGVTVSGLAGGNYNAANGSLAYFGTTPVNCTITLSVKLAADAQPGDVGKITFAYETTVDGSLPSVPEYQYDTVVITIEVPVDYTELNKQISNAQSLNKNRYTADSWANLEKALSAALAARSSKDQAVVDTAAANLKAAIAALVLAPMPDYTLLNEQIKIAQGLNEADYTPDSWANMEAALKNAIAARKSMSQAVVDNATANLEAAIAALVPAVDYSELDLQIFLAQNAKSIYYTEDSWANLESVLADALIARESSDQAVVDAAAEALKKAIDALVLKQGAAAVQYGELNKQIAIAESLNAADYTAESWANLEAALADGIAARESDDQAVVDAAAEALKNAIAALELVPGIDYTELNKQIGIAEGLNKAGYTAESWAAMEAALTEAIAARESLDQAVVDAAAANLKDAIAALVAVGNAIDYTALNAQIAIAEGLNKDEYTAESWAAMETALNAAIAARASQDQTVVDQATQTLADAIAALEKEDGCCWWWILLVILLVVIVLVVLWQKNKKKKTTKK